MSATDANNVKNYARGEVIAEEGAFAQGWFILLSGKVAVFKQQTQIALFDSRGAVMGEISSILGTPRTARLVAVEPCKILHFDATVDQLVSQYPNVAKTVLVSLAQRLERTTAAFEAAVTQAQTAMANAADVVDAFMPPPAAAPLPSPEE
jgi:CRP-like cAMP-binding protein